MVQVRESRLATRFANIMGASTERPGCIRADGDVGGGVREASQGDAQGKDGCETQPIRATMVPRIGSASSTTHVASQSRLAEQHTPQSLQESGARVPVAGLEHGPSQHVVSNMI